MTTLRVLPRFSRLQPIPHLSIMRVPNLGKFTMNILRLLVLTLLFTMVIFTNSPAQIAKWEVLDSFNSMRYTGIDYAGAGECMAIGSFQGVGAAIIRHSSDGGDTWETVYEDELIVDGAIAPDLPWDIAYPVPELCVVAADSGLVLRSTNQGKDWERIELGVTRQLRHLRFVTPQIGAVSTQSGLAWITHDAGRNWSEVNGPQGKRGTFDFEFFEPATWIWLTFSSEDGYQIHRTENNGESWEIYAGPNDARALFFHNPEEGVAVGGFVDGQTTFDVAYYTTDGGETWTNVVEQVIEPASGLLNVTFFDEDWGVAAGGFGKILMTSDGGRSWEAQNSELGNHAGSSIWGMTFTEKRDVILGVTFDGRIFRSTPDVIDNVMMDADSRNLDLAIHPNPASDQLTVSIPTTNSILNVSLFDILGNEVGSYSQYPTKSARRSVVDFNVQRLSLADGVYIVSVRAGDRLYSGRIFIRE